MSATEFRRWTDETVCPKVRSFGAQFAAKARCRVEWLRERTALKAWTVAQPSLLCSVVSNLSRGGGDSLRATRRDPDG